LGRPNFLTCHANPGSTVSVALLQLAYALIYDTGDYQAGISALRAMGYDDNADVATLLGYASRKLGRYDDAKYWYDKALATDPNHHALTWSYYGMWHAEQGNLSRPKTILRRCARFAAPSARNILAQGGDRGYPHLLRRSLFAFSARETRVIMRAALVLGVVATLALSAGAASAQEPVYPRYGYAPHGYGYHHRHYGYHHRYARYRY
jgi:tetratricopeptide (TPR) repeat protein